MSNRLGPDACGPMSSMPIRSGPRATTCSSASSEDEASRSMPGELFRVMALLP